MPTTRRQAEQRAPGTIACPRFQLYECPDIPPLVTGLRASVQSTGTATGVTINAAELLSDH